MVEQKAVVIQSLRQAAVVTDRAIPKLRPGYLLVKVSAVALNPTDWKHVDLWAPAGVLIGCDYAGIVEETGSGYEKEWKKGDRICGMCHGADQTQLENGAFAEYIVVKADVQMKIPENMSDEQAATLGVGFLTVGQGLFQYLKLPLPTRPASDPQTILIYGGSTATGTLGIQLAKLADWKVLTTCSPRNFNLVKSLGADEVFDYSDEDCGAKIRESTSNTLKYVWDTISLPASTRICAEALTSDVDSHYGCILKVDFPREDVALTYTLAYKCFGEDFQMGDTAFEAKDLNDDYEFAVAWAAIFEKLLVDGKVKVHPPKVMDGGLDNLLDGLDLLRKDKVSGQKLVYRVAEGFV